jgi:hypothetical protein
MKFLILWTSGDELNKDMLTENKQERQCMCNVTVWKMNIKNSHKHNYITPL